MKGITKTIATLILLILISTMLIACGEEQTEISKSEVIDSISSVATEVEGKGRDYTSVKKLVATIIDYNNKQDNIIQVKYKGDSYSKTEEITGLIALLDETKNYNVQIEYDEKIPTNITIEDEDVVGDDMVDNLIEQNSIDDSIIYEDVSTEVPEN